MSKEDPRDILYKRWRNLKHRYLVDVLEVHSFSGEALPSYKTVTVRRFRTYQDRTWPVDVFLKCFEPVGRKIRKRTAWDILRE